MPTCLVTPAGGIAEASSQVTFRMCPETPKVSWSTKGLTTPIPPRLLAIYFFAWGGSPQRGVIIPWVLELIIVYIHSRVINSSAWF